MGRLDLTQARLLAEVFGKFDIRKIVILLLFFRPASKWYVNTRMSKFPKTYRTPESSLYKAVDQLVADGFLQLVPGSGRKGRGGMNVYDYSLTLKGILAAGVNTYVLYLDPKTPRILREALDTEEIAHSFESGPAWPFIIRLLAWHRDRKIDLSHTKLDMTYIGSTLALAVFEHPELVTLESLRGLASKMAEYGIVVPEISPKTIDEFRDSLTVVQSYGKNLPLLLGNLISAKKEEGKEVAK
jgi:hypothetical protein